MESISFSFLLFFSCWCSFLSSTVLILLLPFYLLFVVRHLFVFSVSVLSSLLPTLNQNQERHRERTMPWGRTQALLALLSFGPVSSTCRQVTLGKLLMLYLPWFICKMEIITKVPTSEIIAFIIIKWENPQRVLRRMTSTQQELSKSQQILSAPYQTVSHTVLF